MAKDCQLLTKFYSHVGRDQSYSTQWIYTSREKNLNGSPTSSQENILDWKVLVNYWVQDEAHTVTGLLHLCHRRRMHLLQNFSAAGVDRMKEFWNSQFWVWRRKVPLGLSCLSASVRGRRWGKIDFWYPSASFNQLLHSPGFCLFFNKREHFDYPQS